MEPNFLALSKNSNDQYMKMFARGSDAKVIDQDTFDYDTMGGPIAFRRITKKALIHKCWQDKRTFYYMDTGYFGNTDKKIKMWHRIVKNDLQHNGDIPNLPNDRWSTLCRYYPYLKWTGWKRPGGKILVVAPSEKPCKFYGIDLHEWKINTVKELAKHTDRQIIIREKQKKREQRTNFTIYDQLNQDIHAVVTYNSIAATEAVAYGVPTFVQAPNAASPVCSNDLSKIETPYYPDEELIHKWCRYLSYGQFSNRELLNGRAWKILKELP
jgi:hypothetical protein